MIEKNLLLLKEELTTKPLKYTFSKILNEWHYKFINGDYEYLVIIGKEEDSDGFNVFEVSFNLEKIKGIQATGNIMGRMNLSSQANKTFATVAAIVRRFFNENKSKVDVLIVQPSSDEKGLKTRASLYSRFLKSLAQEEKDFEFFNYYDQVLYVVRKSVLKEIEVPNRES